MRFLAGVSIVLGVAGLAVAAFGLVLLGQEAEPAAAEFVQPVGLGVVALWSVVAGAVILLARLRIRAHRTAARTAQSEVTTLRKAQSGG